jgi:hypothetical protein
VFVEEHLEQRAEAQILWLRRQAVRLYRDWPVSTFCPDIPYCMDQTHHIGMKEVEARDLQRGMLTLLATQMGFE